MAFLKKHWLWVVLIVLGIGYAVANPGTIHELAGVGAVIVGLFGHFVTRRSADGGNASSQGSVARTQADVDSGVEGLKRTAETGIGGIERSKATLDAGSNAIDSALAEDQRRKNGP